MRETLKKKAVVLSTLCTVVMAVLLVAGGSLAQQLAPLNSAADLADRKFGPLAKVGGDLADLYDEHQAYLQKGGFAILQRAFKPTNPMMRVIDELVVIDAAAEGDPAALMTELEALGLQNGARFGVMVSGRLPLSAIDGLAALEGLRFARPTYAMTNVGLTTSQGDIAMNADLARATFGVDGTGVTVGVLSDSFDCLGGAAGDVASGDLPPGITVLDDMACPGTDEGRAMMQLIHDVAPGAGQAFHTAANGQAAFAAGIVELATAGAEVIVDDVIYRDEPMFQDGIIAQAVDMVKAAGVSYFSSAGNADRKSYEAPYVAGAAHPRLPLHGLAHDFDPGPGVDICQAVTMPLGTTILGSFQWDEPYFSASGGAGSSSDIDFYIFDATCTTLLLPFDNNNLGSDPVELFGAVIGSVTSQFNIVIANFSGPDPGLMKYVVFGSLTPNEYGTASSTIFGHANAAGAEAVGAAFYGSTPAFGTDPALLEGFSSAGPTPILFDLFDSPVFEVRPKPEIVAPDGTNTTFFGTDIEPDGFPNFFGTSAAAPHAAAVAALLKEFNPTLSPVDVFVALETTALDMGPPGFDDDSGFGLIQADLALDSVDPDADLAVAIADAPDPVTEGGSVTYSVTVTNNGPAGATGVTLGAALPGNVTLISATPSQGTCDTAVSCALGPLASAALATVNIVVIADAAGTITYPVSVAANEIDPTPGNDTATATTSVNPRGTADLSVAIAGAPNLVTVGDNVTYTVTVTNNGPDPATGVVLTDVLPGSVNLVSAGSSQDGNCGEAGGTVSCSLGVLASGASATETIEVTTTAVGPLTNNVSIIANENDPDAANNTASETTTVNAALAADLSVIISDAGFDPVTVGDNVSYTVTVTNNGPGRATGVVLTGVLPGSVSLVSAGPFQDGQCGEAGGTVSCSLGTLASGVSVTVTIDVTTTAAGTLTNGVSVNANETDPNAANSTASETTTVNAPLAATDLADLSVTISDAGFDPVTVGDAVNDTLTATNNGLDGATGVSLTATLPGGVRFVSAVPSRWTCGEAGGTVSCSLGALASGVSTIDDLGDGTPLVIEEAKWEAEKQNLMVKGDQAPPGATVVIKNAATIDPLATVIADSEGKWRFSSRPYDANAVTCTVKAGVGGSFGPDKAVENAPGNCL